MKTSKQENSKKITKVLKALANERRLRVLTFLKKEKEASITIIARHIKLSVHATSKHIVILRNADILEKEQRRLEVYCRIVQDLPDYIVHILSTL